MTDVTLAVSVRRLHIVAPYNASVTATATRLIFKKKNLRRPYTAAKNLNPLASLGIVYYLLSSLTVGLQVFYFFFVSLYIRNRVFFMFIVVELHDKSKFFFFFELERLSTAITI